MYTTRIDQTLRVFFPVSSAGALVTGLLPGIFTAVVVNPQNTATSTPAVAESTKLGVYYFDVLSSFFVTHGAGMYGVTVEVSVPAVVVSDSIQVVDEEADVQLSVTFDAAANTIRANSWLRRERGLDVAGLTNATLRLYDRTGTALVVLQTTVSPDAQGTFPFNFAAPAFAVGETETYFVCTIDDAGPPARTFRNVVGTTFSRTS
jgi:hypothetical protein